MQKRSTRYYALNIHAGQQLSVNDLPVVMEELNKACVKWYNIGMMLPVEIGRLDSIKERCDEMLLFRGVPFPIIA